jgi:uncharacterized coiled-coil DUF342 family protein
VAKTNRTFMQIPKEYLEEKNYEGTRLITIESEDIKRLQDERTEYLEVNQKPLLEQMDELTPELDEFYAKIGPIEKERQELKEKFKPVYDKYHALLAELEKSREGLDAINAKINTISYDLVKDQLSEFEKTMTLHFRNDKFEVEVCDELEEKIKLIRASKK